MQEAACKLSFGLALVAVGLTAAKAQPVFLRKDLQVAGHQFELFRTQERFGGIAIGDFNGDGRPDLLLNKNGGFDVLLNMGGGNFGQPIHTETPHFFSVPFEAADFNGDGKLDLVVPDQSCPVSPTGHILLGRGDGTFAPPRDVPGVCQAAVGDFNKDGRPDLMVNDTSSSLRVLWGNGDGTFQPGPRLPRLPRVPGSLVIADFNRDGQADLAVLSATGIAPNNGYAVSVFLGQGDGTFQAPISTSVGGETLLVADLNGDGLPDLIAGSDILLGQGDGTFQLPRSYSSSQSEVVPVPLAAADFDGDGHVDLAVGNRYRYAARNQVSIYRGNGDGTMMPSANYPVGWDPSHGVTADFDGDGWPDLATSNSVSNTVSLLLSGGAGDSRLTRAVSAASETAVVAPGSLATLYVSTAVGVPAQAGRSPWPTSLEDVSLEVRDKGGIARLAPLLYVSGSQINFLVPEGTALGEATLALVRDGGAAQAGMIQVDAAAPGLFLATNYSLTPVAFRVVVQPDGSRRSQPLFQCSGPNSCTSVTAAPSAAGSKAYLVFYGTGFRNASQANVKCQINGYEFPVEYAGSSGEAGLDQISIPLPEAIVDEYYRWMYDTPVDVVLSIDGVPANRVLLLLELGFF